MNQQVIGMTVKQLKLECKKYHVQGYSDMLRPELRMKVMAARRGLQTLGKFFKPKFPLGTNATKHQKEEEKTEMEPSDTNLKVTMSYPVEMVRDHSGK